MPKDLNSPEQELLAIRCQLGEPAAFDDLVARWHTPLWHYVRRMAGTDELAEELVQEIWLRILRGIANLREPRSLVAWMFGIARRVLMNRLRDKYRRAIFVEEAVDDLPATDIGTEQTGNQDEVDDMLHKLESLPIRQRELLTLFYLDELSIDQVGQVLNIPAGTVKSRLFHAHNMLRQQIVDLERSP
jgi:RNA polymerase sigma-70 factor (ECF subfamily)